MTVKKISKSSSVIARRRFLKALAGAGAALSGITIMPQHAHACWQAPEIPYPGLPDIAFVTWAFPGQYPQLGAYNGPLIFYNPAVVQAVGPQISSFFHAHEYGHICLNHIQQQMYQSNPWARQWMGLQQELEADSFATQTVLNQGNIQAARLAALWFQGQGPIQKVPTHPPGTQRAQNIVQTAAAMGVGL